MVDNHHHHHHDTTTPPTYSTSTSSRGPRGLMTPWVGMSPFASKTVSKTASQTKRSSKTGSKTVFHRLRRSSAKLGTGLPIIGKESGGHKEAR